MKGAPAMSKKTLIFYLEDSAPVAAVYRGTVLLEKLSASFSEITPKQAAAIAEGAELALCPGGCLKPLAAGVYPITSSVLKDAENAAYGSSPYDCLMELCLESAELLGIPAYFTDAMSTDELLPLCRVRSHAKVPKRSRGFRAEQIAAVVSAVTGRFEDGNYISAFIDDQVSIGAYAHGVCLDINDCIGAEGPMGFTSSGDVPCAQLAGYFISSEETLASMEDQLLHKSGLLQYLGTSDPVKVDALCQESTEAAEAVDTMVYQLAKWIGSSVLVLRGNIDGIVLSGKGIRCNYLVSGLQKKIARIAPVHLAANPDLGGYLASKASLIGTYALPVRLSEGGTL